MVNRNHFRIYGYKGKQVRDHIHSRNVLSAFDAFVATPRPAAVCNLGGGRPNSASVLECIQMVEDRVGVSLEREYVAENRQAITSATSPTSAS